MKSSIERLPNGLTVVLRESHAAPVVAFQMWVGVGSADERPHEAGLAHVLEHMLFKGTERRGVGEIARDVERAGGYINAWTSHDETVFHITMASRFASQGLDVLSDAIQNSAIDASELERELQVILEEIRMGEDNPSRVTTELLFGQMFRRHPYGSPVIGSRRTVKSFERSIVKRFYRRWYVPSNVVLVIAGDFETSSMMARVRNELGGWSSGRGKPRGATRVKEPAQRGVRHDYKVLPISEANLAIGFPIPGFTHDDVPALDLLAAVLGQGASSRLETTVRRQLCLATDVRAISFTPRDVGVFGIFAMAPPQHLEALTQAVAAETFRLTSEPISPREVEKARSLLLSEAIYSEETVDGMARKLGYYGLHSGNVEFERRYISGLATAEPGQLFEVARRYLVRSRATITAAIPDPSIRKYSRNVTWVTGRKSKKKVDLGKLKTGLDKSLTGGVSRSKTRAADSAGRDVIVHELSTGDTLIIKPDSNSQTVAARASFLGGVRHEPASGAGLSMLLANAMTRGTTTRTAADVAMQIDSLACTISGFTGRNTIGIHGEFLSRNFAEGYALMASCLRRPALLESEIGRERQLLIDEIRASRDNLDYQAFELFHATLFGKHPYGRSIMGTEETVGGLGTKQLQSYLKKATGAGRMVLAVVGGADPREVVDLTERHLLTVKNGGKKPTDPALWRPRKGPLKVGRSMPKEQSHLVLGFPGTTLDNEERYAIEILVEILGGHGGRLFAGVREERGLAYSVTAMSMEGIEPGYIALYAGTSPGQEAQVVEAMMDEVKALRDRAPSSAEVNRVKRHLIGTRAISIQRNSARAAGASLGYLYGLGHNVDERYPEAIRRLGANQVLEIAQKYLDPGHLIISCVGPDGGKLALL